MSLGNSLFRARKKSGLSQEAVAERLGISRQTVSKWELDETMPDICQSRKLSALYHVTLDELIDFDLEVKEIEEIHPKLTSTRVISVPVSTRLCERAHTHTHTHTI